MALVEGLASAFDNRLRDGREYPLGPDTVARFVVSGYVEPGQKSADLWVYKFNEEGRPESPLNMRLRLSPEGHLLGLVDDQFNASFIYKSGVVNVITYKVIGGEGAIARAETIKRELNGVNLVSPIGDNKNLQGELEASGMPLLVNWLATMDRLVFGQEIKDEGYENPLIEKLTGAHLEQVLLVPAKSR